MAVTEWALDSGGFSELSMAGRWTITPSQYIAEVYRWIEAPGRLLWAAAMDWMCEPFILSKTGKTVKEHQRRTVDNFLLLKEAAPDLPWVPVIQGFTFEQYMDCIDLYHENEIRLADLPLVGLGSICRRQGTRFAADLVQHLHTLGIKVHAFGLKTAGLKNCAPYLESSDSLAWSYDARRNDPLPGCPHASCANCIKWAMKWRNRVELEIARAERVDLQPTLF